MKYSLGNHLEAQLISRGFLSVQELRHHSFSLEETTEVFWTYFKQDQYDLLVSLVNEDNNSLSIQLRSLKNVLSEVQTEVPSFKDISVICPSIKELHLVSLFRKTMSLEDVINNIKKSFTSKTKEYRRKKETVQISQTNQSNVNNLRPQTQSSKPTLIKKTIASNPVSQPSKENLTKKASFDKKVTPVLTNYSAMRSKVDEVAHTSEIKPKKMLIQSDEDIYDPKTFQQMMEVEENPKQAEASAKKTNPSPPRKIITNSDEDEDDEIFKKMQQAAKKKSSSSVPLQGIPPIKPKQEAPKQNQVKSKPNSKGLLGWLAKA